MFIVAQWIVLAATAQVIGKERGSRPADDQGGSTQTTTSVP